MSQPSGPVARAAWLPALTADGWLLFATGGVRNFAYGFLSVILALYLAALGLDANAIGVIFAAALAGGAVMTIALTAVADRLGRRRLLMVGAVLMALAGAVFALAEAPVLLAAAAVLGTISPSGKEVGPFLSIEQAILPETTSAERRTSTFAAYNLVASLAGAVGALAVGLPELLGLPALLGYRALVWGYVAGALVLLALFARLSPAVEAPAVDAAGPPSRGGVQRSRGIVARLAGLFALDAFAGGFIVQSLMAYWLFLRYGADPAQLGAIFFGTNLLSAVSFLAAAPLARRFGLLNTMVFTHLPSNVLLVLVPLMPSLGAAVALLLVRYLLSQLDVPTRQSYTMAIVDPAERAAAAGVLSVARNAGAALGPLVASPALVVPALGLPFIFAGGLKIIYDLAIWSVFRHVRPPEEIARAAARSAASP
jgi:MFS family permease